MYTVYEYDELTLVSQPDGSQASFCIRYSGGMIHGWAGTQVIQPLPHCETLKARGFDHVEDQQFPIGADVVDSTHEANLTLACVPHANGGGHEFL